MLLQGDLLSGEAQGAGACADVTAPGVESAQQHGVKATKK